MIGSDQKLFIFSNSQRHLANVNGRGDILCHYSLTFSVSVCSGLFDGHSSDLQTLPL